MKQQNIKTILYRKDNLICCHSIGLLGCTKIYDQEIDTDTFLYKVQYNEDEIHTVEGCILATDVSLI